MIEIAPELWPQGHCSSPMLVFLCKNLYCKPQSINQLSRALITLVLLHASFHFNPIRRSCTWLLFRRDVSAAVLFAGGHDV